MIRDRFLCGVLVAAVFAGCSGAGGMGSRALLPSAAQPVKKVGKGVFTIRIPRRKTLTQSLRPAYVSPSTNSVSFQVAPAPAQVIQLALGSASCPLTGGFYVCTANFQAPVGNSTMIVKTFASTDGSGPVLSMNAVPITVVQGQVNPVNVVLNGVVSTLMLNLNPTTVTSGQASNVQATWGAKDSSGNIIVGPGSLVDASGNSVAPTLSSSGSHFVVSGTQPTWNVAYDGAAGASTTLTLAATGFTSVAVFLGAALNGDWDSFGYDLQRTGYNPNETVLGTSNIGSVHKLWTVNVGYGMVGEPVLASGVTINSQPTNVIYAGSNYGNNFYAINATTGSQIWKTAMGSAPYSCSGSSSTFGVAGTPAIDRGANRVYVADGQNKMHALDLSTGAEAPGWPITVANVTPDHNFIYGGLTFNPANKMLYVETSSTCDIIPWTGRIEAINTGSGTIAGTFITAQQPGAGGGIWGYGGASIDPATNDVFVATGNSTGSSQTLGYSEQVVELTPDVSTVLANNAPSLPSSPDADFGATPLLFQPPSCPPLAAAVNKAGVFVLYNRSSISSGPTQEVNMSIASDNGDFIGVPAYDPVTHYVYVGLPSTFGIYQPGMGAFAMQGNCTINPTPVWTANFGPDGAAIDDDTPRSAITVANGVVYVSNFSGKTEFAFDAGSGAQLWTTALPGYGIPGTVVSNGTAYVSDGNGNITAWAP